MLATKFQIIVFIDFSSSFFNFPKELWKFQWRIFQRCKNFNDPTESFTLRVIYWIGISTIILHKNSFFPPYKRRFLKDVWNALLYETAIGKREILIDWNSQKAFCKALRHKNIEEFSQSLYASPSQIRIAILSFSLSLDDDKINM